MRAAQPPTTARSYALCSPRRMREPCAVPAFRQWSPRRFDDDAIGRPVGAGVVRDRRLRERACTGKEHDSITAKLLRGAPVARRIRYEVRTAANALQAETGVAPCIATVLVGSAPPSVAYRDAIDRAMGGCGLLHEDVLLPVAATTGRVVETIESLNQRQEVHGILVLLPLPPHIQQLDVISAIAVAKDVDGISPSSVGRLHLGLPALHPSTPQAGMEILDYYHIPIAGRRATVIGRRGSSATG